MKNAYANRGKMKGKSNPARIEIHMLENVQSVFSTYKLSCRGIPTEDGEAYAAENILERKLDKQLDEEDHLPLERCYGIPITGKLSLNLHFQAYFLSNQRH